MSLPRVRQQRDDGAKHRVRPLERVRDAAVRHAVVRATDTLFIPALWFHRILHHPRVERADARNIALTFTRQPPMPELLPFAAGLTRYWSDRRLHACEAPT